MFDTMTITKAVAGLCSTLLIFLLGNWIADVVYMPHGPAPVAYVIDTGAVAEAEAPAAAEPEAVDFEALFAQADAAAGEAQWRNCRACHALEPGRNGTGPSLHGVLGRPIGSVPGFNYSGALNQIGDVWTVERLARFIENPRGYAPGTSMAYAGLRNLTDRLNLIAYIEAQSN